jgi:hypothetical protein
MEQASRSSVSRACAVKIRPFAFSHLGLQCLIGKMGSEIFLTLYRASQSFRASKVTIHLIHVTVLTALHRRITIYAAMKLFSPFSSPMPRGPFSARSDLGCVGVHAKT